MRFFKPYMWKFSAGNIGIIIVAGYDKGYISPVRVFNFKPEKNLWEYTRFQFEDSFIDDDLMSKEDIKRFDKVFQQLIIELLEGRLK